MPGLPAARFEAIVKSSAAYAADPAPIDKLWAAVAGPLYALEPRARQLGLGKDAGVSTYYSSDIEKEDVEMVQRCGPPLRCLLLAMVAVV